MPDFIPLERCEPSQSHPAAQNRNPNYHNPVTFQDNRMTNNNQKQHKTISEERHNQSRRDNSSGNTDRQKRKHSPITHHTSSNQPLKYRSKSPKSIKVIANVANHRKQNASFSEFGQHGNNNHIHYEESRQRRSPIIFDINDPRRHSINESNGHSMQMPSTSNQMIMAPERSNARCQERDNITVKLKCREYHDVPPNNFHNDDRNEEIDILERLDSLERDKKMLLAHSKGLRDTVDQYYREISKLEALIHTYSQEIEIIKRRIYK